MIASPHDTTTLVPSPVDTNGDVSPMAQNSGAAPGTNRRLAWTVLIAVAIFAASFFLSSFRLRETIDIQSDEATYAIESIAFQQTGMTRWNGTPFYVHPPLFFMIEAMYFKALGIGSGPLSQRLISTPYYLGKALLPPDASLGNESLFDMVMVGRYLSVFYGSVLAALLFIMGVTLYSRWFGLLASIMFMVDPYVVRRNHFNMLEPLATLMGLLMILFYFRAITRSTYWERQRGLFAMGVFFGLSLLSKELALFYVPGLIIHAFVFRRRENAVSRIAHVRELAAPMLMGLGIYGLFPLWAALSGSFDLWWSTKNWLFERLSGAIRDTGLTRPGTTAAQTATSNLFDYWPSFLLIGIAGLLVVPFAYFYFRRGLRDAPAELLASFIVGWYGSFVIIWRVGGVINEQFFYFLMPLSIAAVAYAIVAWPRLRALLREGKGTVALARTGRVRPLTTGTWHHGRLLPRVRQLVMPWLVAIVLFNFFEYGLVDWVLRYALSRDDSYAQVEGMLARTAPPGAEVVGRDLLDIYLLPKNPVYLSSGFEDVPARATPMDVAERKIPYAILSGQNLAQGYGGASKEFYDWVKANGKPVINFKGRLYSNSVYLIDYSKPTIDKQIGLDSLSYHKPVYASSTKDGTLYHPSFATDGRADSRWLSGGNGTEWLTVDLGESKSIGRVELTWERDFATDYELQVSDNGQEWTTFFQTDGGRGAYETIKKQVKGRYVRLYMTHPATRIGYSLWEMAVYP